MNRTQSFRKRREQPGQTNDRARPSRQQNRPHYAAHQAKLVLAHSISRPPFRPAAPGSSAHGRPLEASQPLSRSMPCKSGKAVVGGAQSDAGGRAGELLRCRISRPLRSRVAFGHAGEGCGLSSQRRRAAHDGRLLAEQRQALSSFDRRRRERGVVDGLGDEGVGG